MMLKPDRELWAKVNAAILGENAAVTLITLVSGLCSILVHSGVAKDEAQARAHLAAVLLSPDTGKPGSLLPLLFEELSRLS